MQRDDVLLERLLLDAAGRFALATGAQASPGLAWLPTPGDQALVLTLRLYNPQEGLATDPSRLVPPSIRRIVYTGANSGVEDGTGGARPPLLAVFPNPVTGHATTVRLQFTLKSAGEVRLELFDVGGRHVRTLRTGVMDAGPGEAHWDATDDAGRRNAADGDCHVEWKKAKINFVDTSGHGNFLIDTQIAVDVVDAAIVVVSAADGVQVVTERAWEMLDAQKLARAVLVGKLDRERASFDTALEDVQLGTRVKATLRRMKLGHEGDVYYSQKFVVDSAAAEA